MNKNLLKKTVVAVCLLSSGVSSAVDFGGLNVSSLLGQPLTAEISLSSVTRAERSGLSAKLATPEQFKNAGIDYPFGLPLINFLIATRPNGETYIKLSSDQPINDPLVNVLLELRWSSGKILHEFNFQLPVTATEKTPDNPVAEIEPVIAPIVVTNETEAPVETEIPASVAVSEPKPVIEPVKKDEPVKVAASNKKEPLPKQEHAKPDANEPVESRTSAGETSGIKVVHGDTLAKIAQQNKPEDVSLERMLVAMYRANVQVFDGKNMNRLQAGKVLQLPENGQLAVLQQAEAVAEIKAQVADWNRYRQKLSKTTTQQAVPAVAKQEAHGKITAAVKEAAPVVKPAAKEVLKLSKSEVVKPESVVETKPVAKAADEDAIAKDKALQEAEKRTAALEKNIKDLQRLAQLKLDAANAANSTAAPAAETPSEALPAPALDTKKFSLKSELTGNPWYLGGAVAVVLVGLLAFLVRPRRQRKMQAEPKKTVVVAEKEAMAPIVLAESVEHELPPIAVHEAELVPEPVSEPIPDVVPEPEPVPEPIEETSVESTIIETKPAATSAPDIDLREINLNLDDVPSVQQATSQTKDAIWHEVATKIDLAKAYQAMGDAPGMREILTEVLLEGDDEQKATAEEMLKSIA